MTGTARFTVACGASRIGDAFGRAALTFGILARPGATAGQLSVALICVLLPTLILTMPAGVLADRLPRHRLFAAADLVGSAAWLWLALVLATGGPLSLILVGAVLAGCASAVAVPTQGGLLTDLVPAEGLQKANARLLVAIRGADLLGTAAGGSAVGLLGPPLALTVNALSFMVSAGLVVTLRVTVHTPGEPGSVREELRDGWREFSGRPWVWSGTLAIATTSAATAAGMGVLGTTFARDHWGGARAWSGILTATTVGMMCGAVVATRLRPDRPLVTALGAATFLAAPPALLALDAPYATVAFAAFVAGMAADLLGVFWSTTLQRRIAGTMISKIFAIDWLCSMTLVPVGITAAGYLGTQFGTRPALAGCALLIVCTSATAMATPMIRSIVDEPYAGRHRLDPDGRGPAGAAQRGWAGQTGKEAPTSGVASVTRCAVF